MELKVYINRHDYPELDLILWDNASQFIKPELAFHVYETRWRFISHDRLSDEECKLIDELTETHGNGYMLTSFNK